VDWSKIKTIFILTFLALDIYLLYEFFKLRDTNNYEFITETSFEERLASDNIEYVELPKNIDKDVYVGAKPKIFKKDELAKVKGQRFTILDGTVIKGELEEPVKLSKDIGISEVNAFVKSKIIYADQYKYFDFNKEDLTITYYQQYQNRTLYNNINGMLTLNLNDKNEIISYKQTMLEEIEGLSEKQDVLPPLKAIEALYDHGDLKPNSKITKVELGFFTLVQLTASQVLTPTWRFVVDDKENLFVNAFEGQIIEMTDEEKT
jgi:regulatory protein YycI of two-component signal transduction system YycFG